MSSNNSFASKLRARLRVRSHVQSWWLWVGAVLIALAVLGPSTGIVAKGEAGKHLRVSGAGKTMIEGGTGGTAPVPVTTLVAFHADAQGGDFEFGCLGCPRSRRLCETWEQDLPHTNPSEPARVCALSAAEGLSNVSRAQPRDLTKMQIAGAIASLQVA